MLHRFYTHFSNSPEVEACYYVGLSEYSESVDERIAFLLTEYGACVQTTSFFAEAEVLEIGPRLAIETPFSSNAVQILNSMGISALRVERSNRYATNHKYHRAQMDRMTQMVYDTPLTTFETGVMPEDVYAIDILQHGEVALRDANAREGLGMDDWDIRYYTDYFKRLERNPTIVECFQLGNANSEHSRHWFFRGVQKIDGVDMPEALMDIVKEPWKRNRGNSLVAFHDNAGVMQGELVSMFAPRTPGSPSPFFVRRVLQHISATAETHNHPTMVAPFPGAETGSGGRIRDNRAVGRGALTHAGFAGYCMGNLHLPGHTIPGEELRAPEGYSYATALNILIQGSNGVSDYGNKIGEPLLGGFCRSFGQSVDTQQREFLKPVLYSAGLGRLIDVNLDKRAPARGMCIVRIGGPAYRIGVGGGSASSMIGGSSSAELDFKSVQRGNAEMENRVNRVIQACAEMGDNPIESIHDQGAGGPSNVITELMEPAGGRVDIRKIVLGDQTMSVVEIWVAEYQEGYGLLIRAERLSEFRAICERERVNCEVLGEITGDGNVVVTDSKDDSIPVHLDLKDILSAMPHKTFVSEHLPRSLVPLVIPSDLTVEGALEKVLRLPSVGSKGFLTRKVDRSVTGLVVRQQCCGPAQIPVADASVTADSYFGFTGAVASFGEQPIKMLIDPAKGARLAVTEMLTNMCSTRITKLEDVRCRANWMWAAKLKGEGALLYDAAIAMRDIMLELGIAADGGKDSLSMAAKTSQGSVSSPGQLVVMGYAPVPDIGAVCTPDFKHAGRRIGYLRIGDGDSLGGSAFAQALGQVGDSCPDVSPKVLGSAFTAIQKLVMRNHISACHDVSDGGFITTIIEMCLAGIRGAHIEIEKDAPTLEMLFGEQPGIVFEYSADNIQAIQNILGDLHNRFVTIGSTTSADSSELLITQGSEIVLRKSLVELRRAWEATSTRLELEQASPETVHAEEISFASTTVLDYRLSFTPKATMLSGIRPKVAILREEGTNGDREMAAVCYEAGFEPWDISMQDIRSGAVSSFKDFRFLVLPGGFSFADTFGSAKGWAAGIRFDSRVSEMFRAFFERSDTLSLGVCNGCQLMTTLGVLYPSEKESVRPLLTHNLSRRFESRWVYVQIRSSPSIFFRGMEKSELGIWVAHGEGRFVFPDPALVSGVEQTNLMPLRYVDTESRDTEKYPYNPNGSPFGCAALTSPCGRHLAMMPHPERCFRLWQWAWMPESLRRKLVVSPWLTMFQNAHDWCSN